MTRAWWLLPVVMLAGCIASYAPPANQRQPTVRINLKHINQVQFFEEGKDCSYSRKIEKPFNPYLADAKPLPVRGNIEVGFRLGFANRTAACAQMISFVPKFNHDYVIFNKLERAAPDRFSCDIKVLRKHRAAPGPRWQDEETLRLRQPVKAYSADAAHCR